MAPVQDVRLGDIELNVVPGTYRKRNRDTGRKAVVERRVIDRFVGQRQAVEDREGYSWDGVGVGPVWDGAGCEPWPHSASFSDSMSDTPTASLRAYAVVVGGFVWIGLGRRIYKTVATNNASWAALTVAADLGSGYTISGLAYYGGNLLVLLATGQEIRHFNTSTNTVTIWRAGERGAVGAGYGGTLLYSSGTDELRIGGLKWNGNAETYVFNLDAPIRGMAAFGGAVIVATAQSLWRVTGRNYPGEADDAAVTADTSKAPYWTQEPAPVMSHGQAVGPYDFTFLCSYRGRLYTWLGGRVAEWDGSNSWTKHGPEGIACWGACVSGDWLVVAVDTRAGTRELWGFDGVGWWRMATRETPGMVWPAAVGGAGNRDVLVMRDSTTVYDLYRLAARSATVQSYATTGQWVSSLLMDDDPTVVKPWGVLGAVFAAPAQRGNAASSDGITVSLDYSTDAGVTWTTAASKNTTLVGVRTITLESAFEQPILARTLQLRVSWASISDWAPVLQSVYYEVERPGAAQVRRPQWEMIAKVSDGQVRRDGRRDPRTGHDQRTALWDMWQAGQDVPFQEADAGLWTPAMQPGRGLWLQADQLSGLLDGERIAAWPDVTGAGPVPAQADPTHRPQYRTGQLNGKPVVRFASDHWLTLASQLGITAQPFAQFAVWKPAGTAQALMIWANSTGLLVTDLDDDVGISSGSALFNLNNHAFGQWHVVAGVHAGAGSSLTVDGKTPVTGSAGAGFPTGSLTIGAGVAGGDRWLNGDLFALVILNIAPTAFERQRMEGYLAWQAGLQTVLPETHPYKAGPPLRSTTVRIAEIEETELTARDNDRWGDSRVWLVLDGI